MNSRQYRVRGIRGRWLLAAAMLAAGAAHAKDYCCICQGQTAGKTINSFNQGLAVGQCSLECGGFTNVTDGACPVPPPAPTPAPAPAAAPTPPSPTGTVLAYRSPDCSGDPVRLTGSTNRLSTTGILSFQVESGAPASAWEKPDYTGRGTDPVAASICVSPGFGINSIRLH